ncbi:ATP synthase subunit epsilon [Metamycoplasma canadense]|uniref:ATP synthase epsilon chain n=1 Tax=Metamycoplasma canadense TaxID=29554 RepID=A0A077LC49_9BACT|nr:ATP synthase subunit epsilon [Metamycoplasma canadense]BAP39684.1 ATP synthase epsilon chain [Metamycoplasma canadense]
MNNKLIDVVITTHDGVYYQSQASIVTFTTTEGQIGLMKEAIPFLAALIPSQIYVKNKDNIIEIFYIDRGIVEFKNNLLSIIVNNIDIKPFDLHAKFYKQKQTKYTVIEEIFLKKKLAEQKK